MPYEMKRRELLQGALLAAAAGAVEAQEPTGSSAAFAMVHIGYNGLLFGVFLLKR